MNRSETIGKLAAALSAAQGEIGAAIFDATVTTPQYRAKYASLAAVWMAIRKPLSNNGLAVMQGANTVRFDGGVDVTVAQLIAHESGEWQSDEIVIPCYDTTDRDGKTVRVDARKIGGVITYGRRYLLSAGVGVYADEDDDGLSGDGASGTITTPAAQARAHPAPATSPTPAAQTRAHPAPTGLEDEYNRLVALGREASELFKTAQNGIKSNLGAALSAGRVVVEAGAEATREDYAEAITALTNAVVVARGVAQNANK